MKRMWLTGFLALVLFGASGCGAYTSINKAADGSYTVTKVRQVPFWVPYGEVYRCEATGSAMTCTQIGGD